MMTSFYNLLKYAATGQASPDMTYYDRMRASTLMGGAIKTLTGVPPLSFKANGKPLISWSMLGNSQQNGTPAPDAPIMPTFCGKRTGNLWNYTIEQGGWLAAAGTIPTKTEHYTPTYTIRCRVADIIPIPSSTMSLACPSGIKINFVWINANGVSLGGSGYQQNSSTVTAPEDATAMTFILAKVDESNCSPNDFHDIMLNTGSTALPYEPYGWKIPVTSAGQTQNVYLGEVQTTRTIKKLVLTGDETDGFVVNGRGYIRIHNGMQETIAPYSDKLLGVTTPVSESPAFSVKQLQTNFQSVISAALLIKSDVAFNSFLNLQNWLRENAPVTVWYVMTEPETGIINEPLCKIGDYADTLDSADAGITIPTAKGANTLTVDTDLQPSEMTITYRG